MKNISKGARGAFMACLMAGCGLSGAGPELIASAAAQSVPAAPTVLPASFPNTSDGKPISQLGLYWWRYWSYEEPFIDLAKQDSARWSAVLHGGGRMSYEDMWKAGYIDKATLYPKSFPPNIWYMMGGRARHGAAVLPAAYAGTYVITWEGDADLSFSTRNCTVAIRNNCQRRVSANRVEATFDATSTDIGDWRIMRIGPGGVKNIRVFRKSNESLLQAGKILNPRFAAHARRYKVLRFMDVLEASQARPFRAGDFARFDQATWAPEWMPDYAKAPDVPKYPSFETIFRVSMETDTAAWVHVAGLPGAPASFNSLVDPADAGLWKEACRASLQTILASSDWGAYMDGIVSGLVAAKYPTDRLVILEPWNEVWNWGGPWARMTHCSDGVTAALGMKGAPGWPPRYGYGYLAAHAMVEFDKALKRAGRKQAWTLAMGSQMAWDAVTIGGLEGFKRYFADRAADPKPWLRHVGVSTASYYDASFNRSEGYLTAASEGEHLAKLKAAILADGAGLAKRRADYVINGTGSGTLGWMIALRRRHQEVAESYGAYFLGDYEGESHEMLPAYLAADPVVVNWAEEFIAGPQGERVTRAWADALKAQNPNAIISNYMSITPRDPEGRSAADTKFADPWYDGYYGDQSGRTRGLANILR